LGCGEACLEENGRFLCPSCMEVRRALFGTSTKSLKYDEGARKMLVAESPWQQKKRRLERENQEARLRLLMELLAMPRVDNIVLREARTEAYLKGLEEKEKALRKLVKALQAIARDQKLKRMQEERRDKREAKNNRKQAETVGACKADSGTTRRGVK
jgi:hypothetical protein